MEQKLRRVDHFWPIIRKVFKHDKETIINNVIDIMLTKTIQWHKLGFLQSLVKYSLTRKIKRISKSLRIMKQILHSAVKILVEKQIFMKRVPVLAFLTALMETPLPILQVGTLTNVNTYKITSLCSNQVINWYNLPSII